MRDGLFVMLRGKMAEYGDTSADIATLLGYSLATVSHKFNLKATWTQDDMYQLMDRYGVPYEQMHLMFPKGGKAFESKPDKRRAGRPILYRRVVEA